MVYLTHPKVAGIEELLHELGGPNCPDRVVGSNMEDHLILEVLEEVAHHSECIFERVVIHQQFHVAG